MEIAFFDRGPMDSTKLVAAGSWSAYWYNGYIYSSEISRGLDIFELKPSAWLSENELEAAKSVHQIFGNVQTQQKITWPPVYSVARAYLDQLERDKGYSPNRIDDVRQALKDAEKRSGAAQRDALNKLAGQVREDAAKADDAARVDMLATQIFAIARAVQVN